MEERKDDGILAMDIYFPPTCVHQIQTQESGDTDIEGVGSSNACCGGTAALLNCVDWVESKSWDGRYGLVVCTDSAVYAEGPGRPAGGAAAIAMLIGPDAPISFERKYKACHMAPAYDLYKPDPASEFPVSHSYKCLLRC